jgi:hypothetical protein
MVFTDGAGQFQLEWMPLAEQPPITDRDPYAAVEESITVVGREAVLRRFDPTPGPRAEADLDPLYDAPAFVTAWDQGGYRVSAWGWAFADQDDYEAVLGALREVDVDDWLSAMPANVVRPDDTEAVVSDVLADIPTPAGFDRAGIVQEAGVTEHSQLGARVAGAVACAWIDQWITASETGDAAAIQEAATALAGTHDWPARTNGLPAAQGVRRRHRQRDDAARRRRRRRGDPGRKRGGRHRPRGAGVRLRMGARLRLAGPQRQAPRTRR